MIKERTVRDTFSSTMLRIVHHAIAHPLMVFANGADWAVRFHDWTEETPTLKIRFLACSHGDDEERQIIHLLRTEPQIRREVLRICGSMSSGYYPT
jgi:hypothetical protein